MKKVVVLLAQKLKIDGRKIRLIAINVISYLFVTAERRFTKKLIEAGI